MIRNSPPKTARSTTPSPLLTAHHPGTDQGPNTTALTVFASAAQKPLLLNHPNEVTGLLDKEDLGQCRLALRLTQPLDTATCIELTRLLQRADVHVGELRFALSDTLDADALAALLTAAEAHRDSLAPEGFQLQGTGAPLAEDLRLAVAGSPLCLELSASTVRPLLFDYLCPFLENNRPEPPAPEKNAESDTFKILTSFLTSAAPCGTKWARWHETNCLIALALKAKDAALLRAVSVLSSTPQLPLTSLPDEAESQCLKRSKLPYGLTLSLSSHAQGQALATWLARSHPMLQALKLENIQYRYVDCWFQILCGLTAQPALQAVYLRIEGNAQLPVFPDISPHGACLQTLMIEAVDRDLSSDHIKAIAQLIRHLKPRHLMLALLELDHVHRLLAWESPDPLWQQSVHIAWTSKYLHSTSGDQLKAVFDLMQTAGHRCVNQTAPNTPTSCAQLAIQARASRLVWSLLPGPSFGMRDDRKPDTTLPNTTLRFESSEDAEKYRTRTPKALATVIVSAMSQSPLLGAPAVRAWLSLPSGELDTALVDAVQTALIDQSAPETVCHLLQTAIGS